MAFTARLGTSNSYLGNIELGASVSAPADMTQVNSLPNVSDGPIPGAPFFHLKPAQCILHAQFIRPPVPTTPPPVQAFIGPPRPGSPWFNLQMSVSRPITQVTPPPPDIVIVQKILVQSRFSVNTGVLINGRRKDRPGR